MRFGEKTRERFLNKLRTEGSEMAFENIGVSGVEIAGKHVLSKESIFLIPFEHPKYSMLVDKYEMVSIYADHANQQSAGYPLQT